MRFFDYRNNIHAAGIPVGEQVQKFLKAVRDLDRLQFINELKQTPAAEIPKLIDRHLRQFLRKGGDKANFLKELDNVKSELGRNKLTSQQEDAFLVWMEAADFQAKSVIKKPDRYSHREHILANQYKAELDIEDFKHSGDWKNERGEKARQALYTLSEKSKNYKPPTIEELTKVIELLKDYPEAQKIAINKKAKLQSL